MEPQRDRAGRGCDGAHQIRWLIRSVGQGDVHFRIFRKALRIRQIYRAACLVQAVSGPLATEAADHVVCVTEQEVGCVDDHPAVRFRTDNETEEDGLGETFLHCAPLIHVVTRGPVPVVWLDHQDLRPDPLENHDARAS